MTESASLNTEVLVLGGGPGGYTAAFRAADLGKKVVIVERYSVLGGVCSNVGCIPSKALLHLAHTIHNAKEAAAHGVSFGEPQIDVDKVRAWKDKVVAGLATGLKGLAKQRQVTVVQGMGRFVSPNAIEVQTADGVQRISFKNAIIASGSKPVKLPGMPWGDPRLMDSTDALALADIPKRLLIVGGGVIGMEMASVYHALGSKVSVVELAGQLIPGCDPDLVRPLTLKVKKEYENVFLGTKVSKIEAKPEGLEVTFQAALDGPLRGGSEGEGAPAPSLFDRVLVAVGRKPNSADLGLEALGLAADERGFIAVDRQQRTAVSHIFAIGDVVGNPMLAHKATHQGKVAAEVIAGHNVAFQPLAIPSVAYTDPEVAWMGLTETEAQAQGIEYDKAVFPWAASGRAAGMGRKEGLTKIICDKNTQRVLGAGITGVNAGDLISEAMLALEMGADVEDIGLTIHPHPTLSETFAFAAEMVHGSITDLYVKK